MAVEVGLGSGVGAAVGTVVEMGLGSGVGVGVGAAVGVWVCSADAVGVDVAVRSGTGAAALREKDGGSSEHPVISRAINITLALK